MELFIKALAGALVVLIIQLLTRTKSYFIAGMVPLSPTFAMISHYLSPLCWELLYVGF